MVPGPMQHFPALARPCHGIQLRSPSLDVSFTIQDIFCRKNAIHNRTQDVHIKKKAPICCLAWMLDAGRQSPIEEKIRPCWGLGWRSKVKSLPLPSHHIAHQPDWDIDQLNFSEILKRRDCNSMAISLMEYNRGAANYRLGSPLWCFITGMRHDWVDDHAWNHWARKLSMNAQLLKAKAAPRAALPLKWDRIKKLWRHKTGDCVRWGH